MSDNEIHRHFDADAPITSIAQDLLGYSPFAKAVGKGLATRTQSDPFIIGLQAQWGMGKSSAVNLILEAIRDLEAGSDHSVRTRVLHFNPWMFAGLQALAQGYITELSRTIEKALPRTWKRRLKKPLALLRQHSKSLAGIAEVGAGLKEHPGAWGLMKAMKFLASMFMVEPSVESLLTELQEDLKDLPGRVLVVVDDLDRLYSDELRQILTLIKSFGSLPNVTHLLVYDRQIVDSALISGFTRSNSSPTYLEKVVQVQFDLPKPSRTDLGNMMDGKLSSILKSVELPGGRDWTNVWRVGFKHYVRSPRDVVRFSNAFSLTWPVVADEVYLPDFAAIELFRLFDPKLYQSIRDHRDILVGDAMRGDFSETKAIINEEVIDVAGARSSEVAALVFALFPQIQGFKASDRVIDREYRGKLSGRTLGSREGFDSYFAFSASSDHISVPELKRLATHIEDETYLRSSLEREIVKTQKANIYAAVPFLDELTELIDNASDVRPVARALMALGDKLLAIDHLPEAITYQQTYRRSFYLLLAAIDQKLPFNDRSATVLDLIETPDAGIQMAASLVGLYALPHSLLAPQEITREQFQMDLADVESLMPRIARKVRVMVKDGSLMGHRDIDELLRFWKYVDGKDVVRNWISEKINDGAFAITIAFASMIKRFTGGDVRWRRTFTPAYDREIFDLSAIVDSVRHALDVRSLPQADWEDLQRFLLDVGDYERAQVKNQGQQMGELRE